MVMELSDIMILLLPFAVIQISLQVFSLWHLWRNPLRDKKIFFGLLIALLSLIGVAIYWLVGSEPIKSVENVVDDEGVF
ncbi:MAG: hypothetical protein ACFFB2_02375 [Promethearchaeota archaeon]